jgi:putative hemolysin
MTELLIVLVLVLLNGFFAMSEMAVVTARKSKLKELAKQSRRAQAAADLAEHPDSFLSTVQVGITLIGVLTGFFGGEAIGLAISGFIESAIPALDPWAEPIGIGLAVTLITFLSLVFGELVPKRFALTRAEAIATRVAVPMRWLARAAAPAVMLLSVCTRSVLHLLGVRANTQQNVSEEEIRLLVAESHEQGVIDEDERNMMNRVLRLGDRDVASLMTPRRKIAWLDAAASEEQNFAVMRETPFSRYPVYRESDQEVLGVLEVKSLVGRLGGKRSDLFRELRPALFVAESTRALNLLDTFREEGNALALVVDEYGDVQGMVTMNDLLGAVLGRIAAANSDEPENAPVVRRADGSLLVDGSLSSDDLRELLGQAALPDEEDHDYRTLAGLVMARFGRIPQPGEYFEWGGWRFEVVDLDGARIDKLLLQPIAGGEAAAPSVP